MSRQVVLSTIMVVSLTSHTRPVIPGSRLRSFLVLLRITIPRSRSSPAVAPLLLVESPAIRHPHPLLGAETIGALVPAAAISLTTLLEVLPAVPVPPTPAKLGLLPVFPPLPVLPLPPVFALPPVVVPPPTPPVFVLTPPPAPPVFALTPPAPPVFALTPPAPPVRAATVTRVSAHARATETAR